MKKAILASRYLSAEEQLEGGKLGMVCDISVDGIYSGLKALIQNKNLRDAYVSELSSRDFSNRNEIDKFYSFIG